MDYIAIFRQNVKKYSQKPCFLFDERVFTFQHVEEFSNRLANYLSAEGFQHGDVIALILENCIEYPCVWVSLSKLGIIAALINSNLRSKPLIHSIKTAGAKTVITSKQLLQEIETELKEFNFIKIYIFDPNTSSNNSEQSDSSTQVVNLDKQLPRCSAQPSKPIPFSLQHPVFYIYTSGTTGLPKAAVIKHSRFLLGSFGFLVATGINSKDIVYNTLPLYHSHGGWIGVTYSLMGGATVVFRKKFSASNFWKDCIKYKCTCFLYVGELCRFLLAQPSSPDDQNHQVRFASGNGLRTNLWQQFSNRFNIKNIQEFYAATESNAYFFNIDSKVGSCGFNSVIAPKLSAVVLLKFNPTTMEPIRNEKTGLCIKSDIGERGLLVGMIRATVLQAFDGYVNNLSGTQRKMISNVLKKGDSAFNTGDIIIVDKFGYYYFCDRTGDTFRWRGENVSTVEIENILMDILKLSDIVVFGVSIPETDGKAGMVVIKKDNESSPIDLKYLEEQIKTHLASYARPIFIRLTEQIEMTGTFKVKKTTYQDESYDITRTNDEIYYLNPSTKMYQRVTNDIYEKINQGKIKF
ncbi:unnamed protein product [Didymodactylos carnosus]|uniref:Very long-chain fatty acid transport protein n=1 Tax=Didymodactylos carnosus TaxID=1234261 RepID=A0A814DQU9_9BILA|nr:unnamed protein product [Didymodactylos carnosus]CAF0956090.1 unnamed protein product [Didymodactylos carnosus]CAF3704795.1 unnamed protein product [Didymodactylos carnosus]CAF3731101.1 unnamed protein product [Didymodactylos carnosus]